MTSLFLVVSLLSGQTDAPAPPPSQPPMLRMEGTTSAPVGSPDAGTADSAHSADVPAAAPLEPGTRGAPVFLTINSNRTDVKLLRADDDAEACTVPCNRLVPAGPKDIYYLGGKGLTNSNNFDLAEGIKAARVDARVGTKAGKIVGIILTALGAQFLLSGALSMVSYGIYQIPSVQQQIAASGTQNLLSPTFYLVLGLIELAAGGAAFTTGVILWPGNSTRMTMSPVEPPAQPANAAPVEAPPATPAEATTP